MLRVTSISLPFQIIPKDIKTALKLSPVLSSDEALYNLFVQRRHAESTYQSYNPAWAAFVLVANGMGIWLMQDMLDRWSEVIPKFALAHQQSRSLLRLV